ncbi:probable LRR receptor-like serine/threonine-protein kinase At1g05700 [Prunus avium]|uniref:non-specific serine/threonine protein kinase n=1 Tax=Prunus avium TaxID=42229 RepID=A0A6P5U3X0_PRUAV|nr:probable LRR receptor-like serine/threonine-protein kinase At1g05700 [Prunus avium]
MSWTSKQLLFLVAGFALNLMLLVHSRDDQSGFINIACGLQADSSYSDTDTGIKYISDATFIDTGESQYTWPSYRDESPYGSVRSFPEGARNCYKINVTRGNKYLIRASFEFGNYDGQDKIPEFELHLGPNLWDTVRFENPSNAYTYKELIYVPLRKYIHVCLVNTGSVVPFISALELRPLPNASYETKTGSLALVSRYDTGQTPDDGAGYRYPNDILDRIWEDYYSNLDDWTQLNTSSTINSEPDDPYQLPSLVMSTASTPKHPSDSLSIIFSLPDINAEYHSYLHFAEVERLQLNQSRLQYIFMNGSRTIGPFSPPYLSRTTIYSTNTWTHGPYANIKITRAENSTLLPILNAFEIYMVKHFAEAETSLEDVDAISYIKSTYKIKRNWQGDPCSPQDYVWRGVNCNYQDFESPRIISLNLSWSGLTGEIAASISNLKMIQSLNLSSSGLTGEIPASISNLIMLQSLDLSNNSLTGPIPDFLSKLPYLIVLNLEKNKFTGSVPVGLIEKEKNGFLLLSLCDNAHLSRHVSCILKKKLKKKHSFVIPKVVSIAGIFILLLVAAAICWWGFKRKRQHEMMKNFKPNWLVECEGQHFAYSEIVKITNDFASIIGRGGFGTVYLGTLTNETQVAVKLLNSSSRQGSKEFKNEVELLMRARHRNLVSLVGYCNEGETMALVYEYVANGNLEQHLSADVTQDVLTWKERLQIAVDTTRGLEYLHNGCKPPIVHRDLKTSNILLNEKLQAKIADFGLSKVLSTESATHVSTAAKGTFGYLDPQYCNTGWLNKKSDVYSFGIVLLELITGRAAIARDEEDVPIHICQWMCPKFKSMEIESIVDSRLQGSYFNASARKAIEIAMACASSTAIQRPDITVVHNDLKECLEIEMPFDITEIVERYDASSSSSVTMTSHIESQTNTSSLGMLHENSNSLH